MRWAWIFHAFSEVRQDYHTVLAALLRDLCQVADTAAMLSASNSVDNGVLFWPWGKGTLLFLGAGSHPSLRILCRFMGTQDTHNEKYPFLYSHKRPTVLSSFLLCLLKNSCLNFMAVDGLGLPRVLFCLWTLYFRLHLSWFTACQLSYVSHPFQWTADEISSLPVLQEKTTSLSMQQT